MLYPFSLTLDLYIQAESFEEDFLDFPSGTDKFEIWHWFDERCPNGVAEDLMYNTEK